MGGETDGEILILAIFVRRTLKLICSLRILKQELGVNRRWELSQGTEVELLLTLFTGLFKVHLIGGLLRALLCLFSRE